VQSSTLPSSFRDPDGFLFSHNGEVFRQVNHSGREDYDALMASGLYDSLVKKGWLIPHEEVAGDGGEPSKDQCYKTLHPDQIKYISYPYEWCFSQLKDAALLTLEIQLEALKHGMTLKDATAYNVQFHNGRCVFIDTLSFEVYKEGRPWVAYRQFCQHFLAPLALIEKCDFRLLHLLRSYIDGIPLDLTSQLLPQSSWFNYSLLAHIHLHAKTQKQFEDSGRESDQAKAISMSKTRLEGLISSLQSATRKLQWKHANTEWGDYYADTNYVDKSMQQKEQLIGSMLDQCEKSDLPIAADFGANTGKFSRLAIASGFYVLSHDIDEVAVDKNYRQAVSESEESILPLILDITNPSPGLGWASSERSSFTERENVDIGMALALIHHISISNNVPLDLVAKFFAGVCKQLIIEFVPKSDSQVARLLATREDVFPNYSEVGFEAAFGSYFTTLQKVVIKGSERTLYLMKVRG
jgi:ribosomal protein L11 methylase PrmA